jgi:hypothetical protein
MVSISEAVAFLLRVSMLSMHLESQSVRKQCIMLRSITIPFKNLIKHLPFYPLSPMDPVPSSLILSSTRSSNKRPQTPIQTPITNYVISNDITTLDPDPDP